MSARVFEVSHRFEVGRACAASERAWGEFLARGQSGPAPLFVHAGDVTCEDCLLSFVIDVLEDLP